jgi:hypothetical protein
MFALLFLAWVGEWPLDLDPVLYSGLWRSPFAIFAPLFAPVPGIRLSPWQLLLLALVPICLATPGAYRHRSPTMDAAILISVGSIAVTFLWGWMRGGAPYQAYYQLWRFLAALLIGYLVMSIIRRPRDLQILGLTVVCAALIRGTLVSYFYWAHVHDRTISAPDYMTSHDDSLLFVAAIVISGTWALIKRGGAAWTVASFTSLYLLYAIVLNNRRIAWVELAMALVVIYILIGPGALRRRINRAVIGAAPLLLAYAVIGWGREGALFAPIHALSSTGSDYDASSVARQEEIRNLLYTLSVSGNPVLGTGWGLPYQTVTTFYANFGESWSLALYTPHNSLLAVAIFGGLVGVLGIWGVIPVAAHLAASGYRNSADRIHRTAAIAAACILAAYSVHAFGDVGFQSFPCSVMLGFAIGTAGKVAAWTKPTALAKKAALRISRGDLGTPVTLSPNPSGKLVLQQRSVLRTTTPSAPNETTARAAQQRARRLRPQLR